MMDTLDSLYQEDGRRISFIICYNQDYRLKECMLYISQLKVPDGFITDVCTIPGAASMAEGYNKALEMSHARYKVYLHQDVFILNKGFLEDALSVFQSDQRIGMLGMVGSKRLPDNGCMWSNKMRTGALRACTLNTTDDRFDLPIPPSRRQVPVQAIDGLLMMTQYDIPWRSDLFTGWDFYDASQSMEFARAGYRIAVPYQETPWVLHDCGYLNLSDYHRYRKVFLEEYMPGQLSHINDCERRIHNQKAEASSRGVADSLLSLLEEGRFDEAVRLSSDSLSECQEEETFCILTVLLQIYQAECAQGRPQIFDPLQDHPASWLTEHYTRIKQYIWRQENQLPEDAVREGREYFQQMHVSELAEAHIRTFCTV